MGPRIQFWKMSAISPLRLVPIRLPAMDAEGRSCGAPATARAAITAEKLVLAEIEHN